MILENKTLHSTFINIRANSGDKLAIDLLNNRKIEKIELEIETLSMSLQMEFSRIQGSSLHKFASRNVGNQIKQITHDGLNNIISVFLKNKNLYKPHLSALMEKIEGKLNKNADYRYEWIKKLNLLHDFEQIAWQIKSLKYQDVIFLLKYLIIITVFRRSERRKFFPS